MDTDERDGDWQPGAVVDEPVSQQVKPWKGLTSGERKILWLAASNPTEFGELLEAKLREKNGR
jgi:hypothetical protein